MIYEQRRELQIADAQQAVVQLAADFPDVVKGGPAIGINESFIGSRAGDSFLFLDLAIPLAVMPDGETGHVIIVDFYSYGFAANIDRPPLVQWKMNVCSRRLFLFALGPLARESILFSARLIETCLFHQSLAFGYTDIVGLIRRCGSVHDEVPGGFFRFRRFADRNARLRCDEN